MEVQSLCVQSARRTAICSSIRSPLSWMSDPDASNSTSFQRSPTPSHSRPPLSTSTSAACFPTSAVASSKLRALATLAKHTGAIGDRREDGE
ncbi:MAG: hypothetical protein AAB289_11540, partial [Chloroflexota bacterium]